MNGAQALLRTLVDSGVQVCFANPGTSEMHFVAALDDAPQLRPVLCLQENVVTGAADGYGRMTGRPAVTLLHLGPGLGNGLANLHNARRAATPLLNVVGDHATYHKQYDAPLESDIDALAGSVSRWVRRSTYTAEVGTDTGAAITAALEPPGGIATLILPANVSWSDGGRPAVARPAAERWRVPEDVVADSESAVRSGEPTVVLLGGMGTRTPSLVHASRIAVATGARLFAETFAARQECGAGRPAVERLPYLGEEVQERLAGVRHLILAGARPPVSFFAYPGRPSDLVPDGCTVHHLAGPADDIADALDRLADRVAGDAEPQRAPARRPAVPAGPLDPRSFAAVVGAVLPDGAIVVDEATTSGWFLPAATSGAPPHDWLTLTGGAIGQGLPAASGAAIGCPDRPVLCLEADGSAMYTLQALWTQAREGLDVTTVLLNNRSYEILRMELQRVGAHAGGPRAESLLNLTRPDLDFVALARAQGVPGSRATSAPELSEQLQRALGDPGPHLIEAVLQPTQR